MIEYGTFGLTSNAQNLDQTLNIGNVLTQNNLIHGQSGSTNFDIDNYSVIQIFKTNLITSQEIGYASSTINQDILYYDNNFYTTSISITNYYLQITILTKISGQFNGFYFNNPNLIYFGSKYGSASNSVDIKLEVSTFDGIYLTTNTGRIIYHTDEIRYESKTPGALIQSSKGSAAGFLKIIGPTQDYRIRLWNP